MIKDYPLISVIVPTIGRETLERTLDSIVDANYPNLEILVSANNVDLLPTQCRLSYPNTKLVWWNHEKVYPSKAKNEALKIALGKYVTFLDDDDTALPAKFFELSNYLEENSDVFAVFGQYNVRDCYTNKIKNTNCGGNENISYSILFKNNYIASGSIMYRNCSDLYFDEEIDFGEDWMMNLRLIHQYKFAHIKQPTYVWTQNLLSGYTATMKKNGIDFTNIIRANQAKAKKLWGE
jgi:glycosyltransferase involved in cell wall biosynthesis